MLADIRDTQRVIDAWAELRGRGLFLLNYEMLFIFVFMSNIDGNRLFITGEFYHS